MSIITENVIEEKIYLNFSADTLEEAKTIVLETVDCDLWVKSYSFVDLYIVEVGPFVDNSYAVHFEEKVTEALGKLVVS